LVKEDRLSKGERGWLNGPETDTSPRGAKKGEIGGRKSLFLYRKLEVQKGGKKDARGERPKVRGKGDGLGVLFSIQERLVHSSISRIHKQKKERGESETQGGCGKRSDMRTVRGATFRNVLVGTRKWLAGPNFFER